MIVYFAVTFLVSWAAWIGAGLIAPEAVGSGAVLRTLLIYAGTFAPGIVALAMTTITMGRAGTTALLKRLFQADVEPRWYMFAVLYMFTIKLAVATVHR